MGAKVVVLKGLGKIQLPLLSYISLNMIKRILLLSVISFSSVCFAQSHFSVIGGYGHYELANLGIEWKFSKHSSIAAYAGYNFEVKDVTALATGLSFNQTFDKPIFSKILIGYTISTIYWVHDDALYNFKNLSFELMPSFSYPISKRLTGRAEAGVTLTYSLASDRKQNIDAGFPDRYNGGFNFKIIYQISKHEK